MTDDRQTTKDRLLDAAERLFAEKGFAEVSIRELVAAADVNVAAVNYHFQGKDKLFQEVVRRRFLAQRDRTLNSLAEAVGAGGPRPALDAIIRAGRPLVSGLLGLPADASAAFLIGFLRRDFAATRLFDMSRAGALDTVQLVVAMVTITLFIPCIANVFVIAKERGWRTAARIAAFIFPVAFAVGGAVRLLMLGLGMGG